jgi:DNA repair protein RadD
MTSLTLRACQIDLINAGSAAYRSGHRRVLMRADTGFGKTVCFAEITQRAAAKGKRVVITAHRIEIVNQISLALTGMGVRHGRIQPGFTMTADPVQIGMVQTIGKRLDKLAEPDLLVIDEAHHAVAGQWAKVAAAWPNARVLGVTATPQRSDGRGLGDAFDAMVQAIPMADLIAQGYLAAYDYLAPPQQADLSGIGTRMGDYNVDELAEAMDKAVITGDSISHYRDHLQGRPAIAFCVSIAHAEHTAEQFAAAGYRAASVDGKMDGCLRKDRISAIGDGRLQVLTSCDLISEGTDIPAVAGAILLRPTKSVGMFLQQVGRVLRVKADGSRAVILDHVGNVHRHGLPDMPREWTLETRKKKPPAPATKTCKACFQVFAVKPGWMQEPCDDEPGCAFAEREAVSKPALEVVEGSLEVMTAERMAEIKAKPLRELLTGRETRAELDEIRKAKGYKPGWVWRTMQERKHRAHVAA